MKKLKGKDLTREELQKLCLGVLLFFGLIYGYFDMLLNPLQFQFSFMSIPLHRGIMTLSTISRIWPRRAATFTQLLAIDLHF